VRGYGRVIIPNYIEVDILKTFEVLKTSKVWPEICAEKESPLRGSQFKHYSTCETVIS
jgi:hypothetical protein